MSSPKGGWTRSFVVDEDDDDAGGDLGAVAQAQTEDTDAALGDMAAGLDAPTLKEAPELDAPNTAVPRQAFERLSMLAPAMPQQAAVATDLDATNDRDDIERGRQRDSQAALMRSIELGGKQLNAAFGKTPVAELASPASTSYERDATARADRGEAKRFTRTQAELAAAHRRAMLERQQSADAYRKEHDSSEAKRRAERDAHNDLEKDEDQKLRADFNLSQHELAQQGMGFRQREDARATDEAAAKEEKRAREAEDRGKKTSALSMPYDGGTFTIREGIDDSAANQARAAAGLYNGAFRAIDKLKPLLGDLATAKTPKQLADARSRLAGTVQAAATASNSALGQGAMAGNEKEAIVDAFGADIRSLDGVRAFLENDPSVILQRLSAFRGTLAAQADGRLSAYGDFAKAPRASVAPRSSAPKAPQGPTPPDPSEMVSIIIEATGKPGKVPRKNLDAAIKAKKVRLP